MGEATRTRGKVALVMPREGSLGEASPETPQWLASSLRQIPSCSHPDGAVCYGRWGRWRAHGQSPGENPEEAPQGDREPLTCASRPWGPGGRGRRGRPAAVGSGGEGRGGEGRGGAPGGEGGTGPGGAGEAEGRAWPAGRGWTGRLVKLREQERGEGEGIPPSPSLVQHRSHFL